MSTHVVDLMVANARDRIKLEKEFGPDLIADGWVDAGSDGARVYYKPDEYPVLIRWLSPHDGLYYRFRDVLRISLGKTPRTPGVAKDPTP
jgi:hypothetical protein